MLALDQSGTLKVTFVKLRSVLMRGLAYAGSAYEFAFFILILSEVCAFSKIGPVHASAVQTKVATILGVF